MATNNTKKSQTANQQSQSRGERMLMMDRIRSAIREIIELFILLFTLALLTTRNFVAALVFAVIWVFVTVLCLLVITKP